MLLSMDSELCVMSISNIFSAYILSMMDGEDLLANAI